MGGCCLTLAALARPDLMAEVVLFEPSNYPQPYWLNMNKDSPHTLLAMGAARRKNSWESREEASSFFRAKPFYQSMPSESVQSFLDYALYETTCNGKTETKLKCHPEWEAALWLGIGPLDAFDRAGELRCRVRLVSGKDSNTANMIFELYDGSKGKKDDLWSSRLRFFEGITWLNGTGHMVPQCKPKESAQIVDAAILNSIKHFNARI